MWSVGGVVGLVLGDKRVVSDTCNSHFYWHLAYKPELPRPLVAV